MNKRLFFSVLLLAQGACTTTEPIPAKSTSMLDFAQLAAEIQVQHEIIESTVARVDETDSNATD